MDNQGFWEYYVGSRKFAISWVSGVRKKKTEDRNQRTDDRSAYSETDSSDIAEDAEYPSFYCSLPSEH